MDSIQVITRVRSRLPSEVASRDAAIIACSSTTTLTLDGKTFTFDRVLDACSDQSAVYLAVVLPLLDAAVGGWNCTLVCYGSTGTGKTHTITGNLSPASGLIKYAADAGIVPRFVSGLFSKLEKEATDYCVRISFVEIYNEELKDLLSSTPAVLKLQDDKTTTTVLGLSSVPAVSVDAAMKIIIAAESMRKKARTACNDNSSRSHTLLTFTITTPTTSGKMSLVDLAGSENIGQSATSGVHAKEAGKINQSLAAFARVITALVDKKAKTHVPYRDSVLTRLLRDSLGGQTRTTIIATVSPVQSALKQTMSTLEYATKAKSITNKPQTLPAASSLQKTLKQLSAENDSLRGDLAITRSKSSGFYISQTKWLQIADDAERIAALETSIHTEKQHSAEKEQAAADEFRLRDMKEAQLKSDIDALILKVGRLTEVQNHNSLVISSHKQNLSTNVSGIAANVSELQVAQQAFKRNMQAELTGCSAQLQKLQQALQHMLSQVSKNQPSLEALNKHDACVTSEIKQAATSMAGQVAELWSHTESMVQNLCDTSLTSVKQVQLAVEREQAQSEVYCENMISENKRIMAMRRKRLDDVLNELDAEDLTRTSRQSTDMQTIFRNVTGCFAPLNDITTSMGETSRAQMHKISLNCQKIGGKGTDMQTIVEGSSSSFRQGIANLNSFSQTIKESCAEELQEVHNSTSNNLSKINALIAEQTAASSSLCGSLASAISKMDNSTQTQLDRDVRQDMPTHKTPRKKDWSTWRPPPRQPLLSSTITEEVSESMIEETEDMPSPSLPKKRRMSQRLSRTPLKRVA